MPIYLVSGEDEITPAVESLRSRGRRVFHDGSVHDQANLTLLASRRLGRRFVVVAHGRLNGTVRWYKTANGVAADWLWVVMPAPPQAIRLYLYCCHVGRHLPAFLEHCETFGHVDRVPIPDGPGDALVLDFLDEVDRLMRQRNFDADAWRRQLLDYLETAYASEVEHPSSLVGPAILLLLLRSLGYGDE